MLNFIYDTPDILPTIGIYHPSLQPPGKSVKLDSRIAKALFYRCELKTSGDFVLRDITVEDAQKYCVYYYRANCTPAGVLNLNDVVSGDFSDINKKFLAPTMRLLKACPSLSDSHPMKIFCNTILAMDQTKIVLFVNKVVASAQDKISKLVVKKGQNIPTVNEVKIIFEIYQPSGSGRLIHQPDSYQKLSNALFKSVKKTKNGEFTDVFGNTGEMSNDPWPKHRITLFSPVSVFQKNKNSGCYSAYGFNGTDTQPVTVETFNKINTNVQRLFSSNLRGKTWSRIGDCLMTLVPTGMEQEDASNLIGTKEDAPSILDICGESKFIQKEPDAPKDEQIQQLTLNEYKRLAEQVIKNLRGQAKKTPNAAFKMLIIQKRGDGPCATLLNDSVNVAELAEDTQKWADANGAVEKNNKHFKYVTVYDAMKLLNRKWTYNAGLDPMGMMMDGYGESIASNQFSYADMLMLFRHDDANVAQRAINQFGRHHVNLLIDVTLRRRRNEPTILFKVRHDYNQLYALASILFSKKGMTMENVKEKPAYLIGLCVGIIDRLHKQLCDDERGGQYPRQFLGSATVSMFLSGNSLPAWEHFLRSTQFITSWAKYKSITKIESSEWGTKQDYHWLQKNLAKLGDFGIPKTFTLEDRALFGLAFGSV